MKPWWCNSSMKFPLGNASTNATSTGINLPIGSMEHDSILSFYRKRSFFSKLTQFSFPPLKKKTPGALLGEPHKSKLKPRVLMGIEGAYHCQCHRGVLNLHSGRVGPFYRTSPWKADSETIVFAAKEPIPVPKPPFNFKMRVFFRSLNEAVVGEKIIIRLGGGHMLL